MDALPKNADKKTVFESVKKHLEANGLSIETKDDNRPWGGFFVILDSSLQPFLELFFPDFELSATETKHALSPKILLVQPNKRLSWQFHHRRSEYWAVVDGKVGIITSDEDQQKPVQTFESGTHIKIEQGERHRLVGLDEWGMVAEIWEHSDPSNPSDEKDIVRLEDDFGR